MKTQLAACLASITLLAGGTAAQSSATEIERAFPRGGRIVMDLSAGGYTIRGGLDDRIRVRWETRNPDDLRRVKTDVAVTGSAATIRTRGPKKEFRVSIDVPRHSDLVVDLSAGDLVVSNVEGNKNVEMWAGDATIEVGDPALYSRVDASVRFGEITSRPFNVTKGGIFRGFNWRGKGQYSLHAKLFAGDLKLVR